MGRSFQTSVDEWIRWAELHAAANDHDWVGTEHLLLAVCEDPAGRADSILRTLHINTDDLAETVRRSLSGNRPCAVGSHTLPLTPRARRALAAAADHARRHGHAQLVPAALL